jgi:hypothetical protein
MTTSPASSTSSTEGPDTTPPPSCPKIFPGAGNPEQVDRPADVDGDGRADTVSSFRAQGDPGEHYVLQVSLAAGGGATTDIPADDGEASVAVLAGTAVDPHDPRQVVWVRVGSGAATTIVGAYHLDGCDLVAARFSNGDPVELPIGGTVGTVTGAACGSLADPDADLLVYEATRLADERYEVVTTEYRWEDGTFTESPASAPTVSDTDDPAALGHFACGGDPML